MRNTLALPSGHVTDWDGALLAFLAEKERRTGSRLPLGRLLADAVPLLRTRRQDADRGRRPRRLRLGVRPRGLSGREPSAVTIGARIACLSSFYRFPESRVRRRHQWPQIPPSAKMSSDGWVQFIASLHRRRRDTSGAARTNSLAAASSSIHRPMASYETGNQEFRAPSQSAEATGRSSLPRELTPARTRVQRSDENAPRPSASTTACCSEAPRPIVAGIHEKKRMAQLAGFPGGEASSVLITMMRSTPAANIDSSTVAMFAESRAERS